LAAAQWLLEYHSMLTPLVELVPFVGYDIDVGDVMICI
jgi:hypothetical protein